MIQPPLGKPWLLYVLLGSSLALNVVMLLDRHHGADDPVVDDSAVDGSVAEASAAQASAAGDSAAQASAAQASAAATPVAADLDAAAPAVLAGSGWRVTTADVEHSLARTFQQAAGEDGDALAAAYARQFVWDLDLRRDLQRGDRVEVLWRPDPTEVIVVAAARLRSGRLGRTLEAWRWQRPGDSFPSYWDADGVEVPYRLVDGPLDDYEQVTALLKDRPTHKGMDFKTPVGTPVRSPKAATVTRVDWNWRYNGHCIELRYDDGVIAKLLHLSENRVQAGQRVAAGQVIALSGNTGRSTAPHLHYELHRGDRVLDPLEYHEVQRRRLSADELARFRADQARLAATLDRALASL